MKKRYNLLLVGALLVAASAVFTGCGKKESAEETTAVLNVKETEAENAKETEAEKEAEIETKAEEESQQAAASDPAEFVSPDDIISLPFASEHPFNPTDYPDLPKNGIMPENEIDNAMEAISDLMAFDFSNIDEEPEYYYGEYTMQILGIGNGEEGTQIYESSCATGDSRMDEIMNKVGYEDYEVHYYYPHHIWTDIHNAPAQVNLTIGEDEYIYYFVNNNLVYRIGPDGERYNPETNEFMNGIYKLGCYYGNVIVKEKDRYSFVVSSMDCYNVKKDSVEILVKLMGMPKEYTYILDKDTVFDESCDTGFFSGYEEGDTPYEWFTRVYDILNDPGYEDNSEMQISVPVTTLMGVFDEKTTGNHIDAVCGTYWWD